MLFECHDNREMFFEHTRVTHTLCTCPKEALNVYYNIIGLQWISGVCVVFVRVRRVCIGLIRSNKTSHDNNTCKGKRRVEREGERGQSNFNWLVRFN